MALKLSKRNTRKIKIVAKEPGDLSEEINHNFIAEFKIISPEDWKVLMDDDDLVKDVVKDALVNVEGVTDEEGKPIYFDDELANALVSEPWILKPLFNAQLAIQGGTTQSELYKKERSKN